jgi:hypothetical protein
MAIELPDKDLVENPPTEITSAGYAALFDAHAAQCVDRFVNGALPRGGLLTFFRPKLGRDIRAKVGAIFEAGYRKLMDGGVIELCQGEGFASVVTGPADRFHPIAAFIVEPRVLVVPDRFLVPRRRIVEGGAAEDAEPVAMAFGYELVAIADAALVGSGLARHPHEEACCGVAFGIGYHFDSESLEKPPDGKAATPVLCYASLSEELVLLPHAAHIHDSAHSMAEAYFAERASGAARP